MSTPENRDGWKKSSYSNTGNGCVEVSRTLAAVRDSKQPGGPALVVDVGALVAKIRENDLQGV